MSSSISKSEIERLMKLAITQVITERNSEDFKNKVKKREEKTKKIKVLFEKLEIDQKYIELLSEEDMYLILSLNLDQKIFAQSNGATISNSY